LVVLGGLIFFVVVFVVVVVVAVVAVAAAAAVALDFFLLLLLLLLLLAWNCSISRRAAEAAAVLGFVEACFFLDVASCLAFKIADTSTAAVVVAVARGEMFSTSDTGDGIEAAVVVSVIVLLLVVTVVVKGDVTFFL
jgi:hypothetical protein